MGHSYLIRIFFQPKNAEFSYQFPEKLNFGAKSLERNLRSSGVFGIINSQNPIRRISSSGLKHAHVGRNQDTFDFFANFSNEMKKISPNHSPRMIMNSTGVHGNKSIYLSYYHCLLLLVAIHFSSLSLSIKAKNFFQSS